jgi:RimJ/RimL family protein N-acetyltransferase
LIATERLLLRPWEDRDLRPYAAMNADPLVREFFPALLSAEESDSEVRRFQRRFERDGFGPLAAELSAEKRFIGFIGIQTMPFEVPSLPQPAIEIGWRLAPAYWRRGLATEGARAVLDHAFSTLDLQQVVAIAAASNEASRAVMRKIGMRHIEELDFQHPRIPEVSR